MKIIKIIFYNNKFIDFLCFKGFIPSLADLKGMIIPPPAERGGMIIPLRSARGGMNIPLNLEESMKIYLMTWCCKGQVWIFLCCVTLLIIKEV